jgi:hypothetical protein
MTVSRMSEAAAGKQRNKGDGQFRSRLAASNKLFHEALFELPEADWWGVEVSVDGPHGPARARFEVEAGEAPPRWQELWPWFGWPAVAVALFGLHRALARRRRPTIQGKVRDRRVREEWVTVPTNR